MHPQYSLFDLLATHHSLQVLVSFEGGALDTLHFDISEMYDLRPQVPTPATTAHIVAVSTVAGLRGFGEIGFQACAPDARFPVGADLVVNLRMLVLVCQLPLCFALHGLHNGESSRWEAPLVKDTLNVGTCISKASRVVCQPSWEANHMFEDQMICS